MPVNELTVEQIQFFLLVFIRISSIVAFIPIFSTDAIPIVYKAGFSFLCSLVIFPHVALPDVLRILPLEILVLTIIKEIFVGVIIGFMSFLIFAIIQFSGKLIDTQIGFAMAEIIDPFTNTPTSILGQFMTTLFTLYFLLVNGHYFFIITFQKSFDLLPIVYPVIINAGMMSFLVKATTTLFIVSLRLAAPLLAILFLVELSLGIIARTIPQINIFFVGLPVKLISGLLTFSFLLGSIAYFFKESIESMVQDIWKLIMLMAA